MLLKRCSGRTPEFRSSLFIVMKEAARRLHWMDNNDDAYHDHIQTFLLKKVTSASKGCDCFLVMTEAAERLCQMDNHVDVYRERIQKLKAKAVEDGVKKQNIAIEECEKHLQLVLEAEKWFKDKLLAERVQIEVQIKEKKEEQDKTLTIKDNEIEALKQQVASLEEKDSHMASDIITKDKTLAVKDKEIDALKQQLESLEAKDNGIQDLKQQLGAEALEKTIKVDHDRSLLLTEFIPNMLKDPFQRYDDTVQIWTQIRPSLRAIEDMMNSCVTKKVSATKTEEDTIAEEDSDEEFYDLERTESDPTPEASLVDAATAALPATDGNAVPTFQTTGGCRDFCTALKITQNVPIDIFQHGNVLVPSLLDVEIKKNNMENSGKRLKEWYRYLSVSPIPRRELQLLSISALLRSSKYEKYGLLSFDSSPVKRKNVRRASTGYISLSLHTLDMEVLTGMLGGVMFTFYQSLQMTCWWAENPNGDEFRYHLAKVPDYLWIGEDGMTMNCFGSQAWDWSLSTKAILSSNMETNMVRENTSGDFTNTCRQFTKGTWTLLSLQKWNTNPTNTDLHIHQFFSVTLSSKMEFPSDMSPLIG
ncbi:squalene cyclase [Tanacetum coccineum]